VLRVLRSYGDDEANTENATTLMMRLGGPNAPGQHGIHWHTNPGLVIEYVASDADRQTIPWVRVTRPDGSVQDCVADGTTAGRIPSGECRTMDCLDCHNTIAHRIEVSAEAAVDRALARGALPRSLPYLRRESVRLLQASHASTDVALAAIDEGLRGFYKSESAVDAASVGRAVSALRAVYERNVFPTMKVTFGVYPDNIGHTSSQGCFRCHDGSHAAKDGSSITSDCESCHRMLDEVP